MFEVSNNAIYLSRMENTLVDKVWWVEHLPKHIKVVVDFGCANGALGLFLNKHYPNRFKYIGIDKNNEFLTEAELLNPKGIFFSSLEDFKKIYGTPLDSVLVLNSVIHELYTYMGNCEARILLKEMFNMGFDYIAIRDMKLDAPKKQRYHYISLRKRIALEWQIRKSDYFKSFKDYKQFSPHPKKSLAFYEEFFLKYFYEENWEREKRERYLWNWTPYLKYDIGNSYIAEKAQSFCVPYVRDKVKADFGYDMFHTHVKLLLRKE